MVARILRSSWPAHPAWGAGSRHVNVMGPSCRRATTLFHFWSVAHDETWFVAHDPRNSDCPRQLARAIHRGGPADERDRDDDGRLFVCRERQQHCLYGHWQVLLDRGDDADQPRQPSDDRATQAHFTYRASAYFDGEADEDGFFDWRRSAA